MPQPKPATHEKIVQGIQLLISTGLFASQVGLFWKIAQHAEDNNLNTLHADIQPYARLLLAAGSAASLSQLALTSGAFPALGMLTHRPENGITGGAFLPRMTPAGVFGGFAAAGALMAFTQYDVNPIAATLFLLFTTFPGYFSNPAVNTWEIAQESVLKAASLAAALVSIFNSIDGFDDTILDDLMIELTAYVAMGLFATAVGVNLVGACRAFANNRYRLESAEGTRIERLDDNDSDQSDAAEREEEASLLGPGGSAA